MGAEPISLLTQQILDTIFFAQQAIIAKDDFTQFSSSLGKILPFLERIVQNQHAIQILSQQVKLANTLIREFSGKHSRIYLLINCYRFAKPDLEAIIHEIGHALSLVPLHEDIGGLIREMVEFKFELSLVEDEVVNMIDSGIQERNFSRSYANSLLTLIAEAIAIEKNSLELKREFDQFKDDTSKARKRKGTELGEAIRMDQIVCLLERADATLTFQEKEVNYSKRRDSLGTRLLEPLQSFYCPITGEVMEDPVETSMGQTFERRAIEKWIKDGNTTCPLTVTPLNSTSLRGNITLKRSIEEWKERNAIIRISSIKAMLGSGDNEEVVSHLKQLKELCRKKDLYREYVVLENCLKVLVGLLGRSNLLIRNHALCILIDLAKDSDDVKELIAGVDNGIELIVRSLSRRSEERKLAVSLLLELSKCKMVRDNIANVHGCVLLLVTISNSDNNQASSDARDLLEVLSFLDENIVQMAKANYFKPLLHCLSSGSDDVKKIMVSTLAELELTDHSKATLFHNGALEPLLNLITHRDTSIKTMAITALKSLSSLHQNGLEMIRKRAVSPLLELLRLQASSPSILLELVAATIMNIANSLAAVDSNDESLVLLESDDDISWLFSLLILSGPNIQHSILQTFYALSQLPSAEEMRTKLRQFSAVRLLIPLCDHTDPSLRANAVKLLSCLIEGGDASLLAEHVNQSFLESLLSIIETSKDDEEVSSSMHIIAKLPSGYEQITRWLLDADALATIIKYLKDSRLNGLSNNQIVENAVGALCYFIVSTNPESQSNAAEAGVIPLLVQLLGFGTALTKTHAAISLAQFSESSLSLTMSIEKRGFFFQCCSPPVEVGCMVHSGICSVETSYCLLEANAVGPLVKLLGDEDGRVCDAALRALSTLLEGEMLEFGSKVISDSKGFGPIIRLLNSLDNGVQERAMRVLERVFQFEEYKKMYGASAQMLLVDIAQRGTGTIRALAARVLARLDVLHYQSSYF